VSKTTLAAVSAVALLTAAAAMPAQADWRCPYFNGAYAPTVTACPNWEWDPNGPRSLAKAAEQEAAAKEAAAAAAKQARAEAKAQQAFIAEQARADHAAAVEQARQEAQAAAEQARQNAQAAAEQAHEEAVEKATAAHRAWEEAKANAEQKAQADADAEEKAQLEKAIVARQETAENSPNNTCKQKDVARKLIQDFNKLGGREEAVDIEHLITNVGVSVDRSCHGIFVMASGVRLEGNMVYRENVAGDPLVNWVNNGKASLPPLPDLPKITPAPVVVPPEPPPAPPLAPIVVNPVPVPTPAAVPAPVHAAITVTTPAADDVPQGSDPMFQKGLSDRAAWETWFNGLQGDEKTGAFFWSGQRSLAHPGSCNQMSATFTAGCTAAKVKLAASDVLRKSEPSYKLGWNVAQ
jgi:hypothetical protein